MGCEGRGLTECLKGCLCLCGGGKQGCLNVLFLIVMCSEREACGPRDREGLYGVWRGGNSSSSGSSRNGGGRAVQPLPGPQEGCRFGVGDGGSLCAYSMRCSTVCNVSSVSPCPCLSWPNWLLSVGPG